MESTGLTRIDELFSEAATTIARAGELRDAHYTSAMALRELCCMQTNATLKQCVKHLAQRLASIGASRHARFHIASGGDEGHRSRKSSNNEALQQQALLSPPNLTPDEQQTYFNFQQADQSDHKLLSSYKNLRIELLSGKYIPSSLTQIIDETNALITASTNLLTSFKEVHECVCNLLHSFETKCAFL